MAKKPQAQKLDDAGVLEDACARNRAVEIHYYNHSGEFFAARTRLLELDAKHLQLDAPQSIGKEVHFNAGQSIEAFILMGEHIYTFRSKIVQTQCHIKLNRYVTVDGLFITRPNIVKDGQRRHDLRVSVGGEQDIAVVLHEADPNEPNTVPIDATVFSGRLVNLSGGGCGVLLYTTLCSRFKIGRPVFLGFTLPDEETPLMFQAEVRSAVLVPPDQKSTRVGVQFLAWPNRAYLRRTLRPIERFVAAMQRKRLARR